MTQDTSCGVSDPRGQPQPSQRLVLANEVVGDLHSRDGAIGHPDLHARNYSLTLSAAHGIFVVSHAWMQGSITIPEYNAARLPGTTRCSRPA